MQWRWSALGLLMAGAAAAQDPAVMPGTVPTERPSENIALGASYTLDPAPNYGPSTDAADSVQLTDGAYTVGYFWTQPSTVGWQQAKPAYVTLDLGAVKPIRGVSFHTAGGFADVTWPLTIRVLVAGEDRQFREIGDLVQLSARQHGRIEPVKANDAVWALAAMGFNDAEIDHHYNLHRDRYTGEITAELRQQIIRDLNEERAARYGTYRYWTDRLRTHGRYVSLVVWSEPFTFVDEIEVYAGEPEWVDEPLPGSGTADLSVFGQRLIIQKGIHTRLVRDIEALREAAQQEGIPEQTRRDVLSELAALEANLGQASAAFGEDFRAVLPLNEWHERVMRTQASLWRARSLEPLTFWRSKLWDPVLYIGMPNSAAALTAGVVPTAPAEPALDVHLMRKEYRAAAFNVSNSTDELMQVSFRLSGLPGGDNPGYVTVHEVLWTDTRPGVPVAAALPEVVAQKNLYTVSVPSGMTRQVWLTFHPVDVEPGVYEGEVVVESMDGGKRFPLHMHLYPLDFPEKQSLHLGGWDYTDEIAEFLAVTDQNRLELIAHLREHFVDSPWGTPRMVNPFYPDVRGAYDAQGAMTTLPETAKFDKWLELWPGAARYFLFAKVGSRFVSSGDGEYSWSIDTPEFATAVKAWAKFWVGHAVEKGLKPEQLVVLLVDEPDEDPDRDHIILAWAKAIREAAPGVRIWEDLNHRDMNKVNQAMIDACHILSPHIKIFLNTSGPIRPDAAGEAYRAYYKKKQEQEIALEFYNADGPTRLLDPYAYYRLTAWWCWRYGAEGMTFWSLTDTGESSSWNPYLNVRNSYAPMFIDENSVTAGKHLEAQREGVEDYEYFAMLARAIRQASAQGQTDPQLEEARRLLESLPVSVSDAALSRRTKWLDETMDRTLADSARIQVLAALTTLAER